MAQAQTENYLFDSLYQAITFAYRFSHQSYSPSLMQQMMGTPSRTSGKCLGGLDGAAQAGIIRGILAQNLDVYELHMLSARFAINERESIVARLALVPVVIAAMPTGMHSRRAADALVQKWFGARFQIQDIAERTGFHRSSISPAWGIVKRILREIDERAENRAHTELRRFGLIP